MPKEAIFAISETPMLAQEIATSDDTFAKPRPPSGVPLTPCSIEKGNVDMTEALIDKQAMYRTQKLTANRIRSGNIRNTSGTSLPRVDNLDLNSDSMQLASNQERVMSNDNS